MASEVLSPENGFRQSLTMAVAAICLECGFESTENIVLETLTEMLQSYLTEVGNGTRAYYEHSGRTIPTDKDVIYALSEMGFRNKSLLQYSRRGKRINIGQIVKTVDTSNPPVLQVGKSKGFPTYVPENHKYPHFPDPHSYIRTTTGQKPETDYVILREQASAQKRDVERALTRFVARTGRSHPLLPDDKNAFPLIEAQPHLIPYLNALLPSEHETLKLFEATNDQNNEQKEPEKDPETPSKSKNRKLKKKRPSNETTPNIDAPAQPETNTETPVVKESQPTPPVPSVIHNPYLRPVKKPKLKKKAR
ncbi:transcription initiation factor TFIID subunit 8-like isoform X2 [Ciona intestinalis]